MSVAEDLKSIAVLDAHGKEVPLGLLWCDHTVVLAFVRHFGCVLCREQVTELNAALPTIHRCGAELVIVGSGRPEHVADFCEAQRITTPVYVDPEQKAYRAAGLVRSVWSSIKPKAWLNSWRAHRAGMHQGPTQGDMFQQGGVFVIRPGNVTCYSYVSEVAGDHPPVDEVIAAV
jgi:peroxiredoxin